jgi:hypothetical protein
MGERKRNRKCQNEGRNRKMDGKRLCKVDGKKTVSRGDCWYSRIFVGSDPDRDGWRWRRGTDDFLKCNLRLLVLMSSAAQAAPETHLRTSLFTV